MIHAGEGTFELEPGDWTEIVLWSDHRSTVSDWENPIFSAQVARWLLERHVAGYAIHITSKNNEMPFRIIVADPHLAMEFRLRWCESRGDGIRMIRERWKCCAEQELYARGR